jgi:hypothetical protein
MVHPLLTVNLSASPIQTIHDFSIAVCLLPATFAEKGLSAEYQYGFPNPDLISWIQFDRLNAFAVYKCSR